MTTDIYFSGVLDKKTKEYVFLHEAKKHINYSCLDCKTDVILRAGKINRRHFAHKKKDCGFYTIKKNSNYPGESQMHKDAKYRIESLINKNKTIKINTLCFQCNKIKKIKLVKNQGDLKAIQEHKFIYNDSNKFADIGVLKNDKLELIIEIFHTHITKEQDRPEPWVELSAFDILEKTSKERDIYDFDCSRSFICSYCKKENDERIKQNAIREKKQLKFYKEQLRKERIEQLNKKLEEQIIYEKEKKKQEELFKIQEVKRKEEEHKRRLQWIKDDEERKEKERIEQEKKKEIMNKLNFNFQNNQLEHIINNKLSCELISKKNTYIMFYYDDEVVFSKIKDKYQYEKYWNKLKNDSQKENYLGHYLPFIYRSFTCKIEKLTKDFMYDLVSKC